LLVINLKEKDSYARYCKFLGIEQKKDAFPWETKQMKDKIDAYHFHQENNLLINTKKYGRNRNKLYEELKITVYLLNDIFI